MRTLAVIPARAGSKRVPGKNTKLLGARPLLAWTVKTALDSNCDTLMVSTESEDIAGVAESYGADVPFLRSPSLADDESDVVDALIEIVERYSDSGKTFDSIVLLQPTSPFRRVETINAAISLHEATNGDSVVSVSPASVKPQWLKRISDALLRPYPGVEISADGVEHQPDAYQLNGLVYVCSVRHLLDGRSLYSASTRPLVINSQVESLDIDTPFDWRIAECFVDEFESEGGSN